MAKTPGFVEYVDDRDSSITDVIRDGAKRAADWFEDSRIDANGVTRTYLFSKENHEAFTAMMKAHDKEFIAWMNGGAKR